MNNRDDASLKAQVEYFDDLLTPLVNQKTYLEPCGNNLYLLVLNGHAILDYQLDALLARLLHIQNLPDKPAYRIDFIKKLGLVRAVTCEANPGSFNADLFVSIEELGTLRNTLAHNLLKADEVKSELDKFLIKQKKRLTGVTIDLKTEDQVAEKLRSGIFEMVQFLIRVAMHLTLKKRDKK